MVLFSLVKPNDMRVQNLVAQKSELNQIHFKLSQIYKKQNRLLINVALS